MRLPSSAATVKTDIPVKRSMPNPYPCYRLMITGYGLCTMAIDCNLVRRAGSPAERQERHKEQVMQHSDTAFCLAALDLARVHSPNILVSALRRPCWRRWRRWGRW
jgi:hypothetical protein